MADEMLNNEDLGIEDHHEEVAALDAQIAAATKDEMSDAEKDALEKLVSERNEVFLQHAAASTAE